MRSPLYGKWNTPICSIWRAAVLGDFSWNGVITTVGRRAAVSVVQGNWPITAAMPPAWNQGLSYVTKVMILFMVLSVKRPCPAAAGLNRVLSTYQTHSGDQLLDRPLERAV